jgi:hypothetical protein
MEKFHITPEQLAAFGAGSLAYVREIASEDIQKMFPDAPALAPGMKLFALLAANGQPIMLADSRDVALAGALQNELQTVALH